MGDAKKLQAEYFEALKLKYAAELAELTAEHVWHSTPEYLEMLRVEALIPNPVSKRQVAQCCFAVDTAHDIYEYALYKHALEESSEARRILKSLDSQIRTVG